MTSSTENGHIPLGLASARVNVGAHIAHFYRGQAEMFTVVGPYLATGLQRGEKCAFISSPETASALRTWLEDAGCDPRGAEQNGQLALFAGQATADDMLQMFEGLIADSALVGDEVIRLAGDASWALDRSTSSEMLRWEALYDNVSEGWPMIALCQFDLTRFAGDVVIDALRSHPLCIMGTVLVPNSLHESPAQMLEELAERS
jgi:hypothetical protein